MVCETSLIIVTPYQCCLKGELFWYLIRLEQHKVGCPVGIKYILLIMVCETNLLTATPCQYTCKVKLFWYLIGLKRHKYRHTVRIKHISLLYCETSLLLHSNVLGKVELFWLVRWTFFKKIFSVVLTSQEGIGPWVGKPSIFWHWKTE